MIHNQNCGASLAIWDHTVLLDISRRGMSPALGPTRQVCTRFTDHGGIEG